MSDKISIITERGKITAVIDPDTDYPGSGSISPGDALKAGDRVITESGKYATIEWVRGDGRISYITDDNIRHSSMPVSSVSPIGDGLPPKPSELDLRGRS